jgi:hypothetical protein
MPLDLLATAPIWFVGVIAPLPPPDQLAALAQSADTAAADVNRVTTEFLRFGQRIAAGICGLAILWGFIQLGWSRGNPSRSEHGWDTVMYGLIGLVGVAVVSVVVALVRGVFPVL